MRAVVMEIKSDHIIVLTKDGQFKKTNQPKNKIEVGMEININDPMHHNLRRIAAIIVVVILMSGFGVSAYAYYTPYGYINLDINPNIEIIYNRFNRVLTMNGINEDGKNLVDNMEHYKHEKVEDMMSEIINQSIPEEKLEDIDVLITYNKINKDTLDLVKVSIDDDSQVNVYAVEVSESEYEEAKNNEISAGKVKLIENIQANNPKYNTKELEEKSVKELIEIIHEEEKTDSKRKMDNEEKQNDKEKNQKKEKNRNKDKNKEDQEEQDHEQSKELKEDQEDEEEKLDNKGKKSVFKNNKKKNKEVKDQEEVKEKESKEKKSKEEKKEEKDDDEHDDDNENNDVEKEEEEDDDEVDDEDDEVDDDDDEEDDIRRKSEQRKNKGETEDKDKENKGKNNRGNNNQKNNKNKKS